MNIHALVVRFVLMMVIIDHGLPSTVTPRYFTTTTDVPTTPQPCKYQWKSQGLKANCTKLGLTSVPRNLLDDVADLDLSGNKLSELKNNSFAGLPLLTNLTISKNNVSSRIEKGTFRPLTRLKLFAAESNNLTSLPDNLFKTNRNLETIDLSYNNLTFLPDNLFQTNPNLETIDLSHNNLTSFPSSALNSLQNLSNVDLGYNPMKTLNFTRFQSRNVSRMSFPHCTISSLHEHYFLGLQQTIIGDFSLIHNRLTVLPDFVFRYLEGVKRLDLDGNTIANFSLLPYLGMKNVEVIDIPNCRISNLTPLKDYTNASHGLPVLRELYMSGNKMFSVPSGAFQGLDNLIKLDIHQSGIRELHNDSFIGLNSLEILDLSSNSISVITSDMFKPLLNLRTLKMIKNSKIKEFSRSMFAGIQSLVSLTVSRCKISKIETGDWDLPALEWLDLSYNPIQSVNKYAFGRMNNLTTLILSNTQITAIENKAFISNSKLQELMLRCVNVGQALGSISTPFANLNELTLLDFTDTAIALQYQLLQNLSNLQRLYLANSGLSADDLWDPHNETLPVLSSLKTLKFLSLSNNNMDNLQAGTFAGLGNLTTLEMINSNIATMDKDIFADLTSLAFLYLDKNKIKNLSPDYFTNLSSLVVVSVKDNAIKDFRADVFQNQPHFSNLYISRNQLTTIPAGTIFPKKIVDVSENPLACICDLRWFRYWIHKTNVSVIHLDKTTCSRSSILHLREQPITKFDPERECAPDFEVFILSSFLLLFGFLGLLLGYHKRWWIRHRWFHLKLKIVGYNEVVDEREREDYEYDINLMFDEEDEAWVRATLKPGLEENLPNFDRIVCGDDDLPLGMYYIEAIIEVIDRSFKTVLVVSNAAVDNHGFINKLRMAVENMNDVEVEKVVLVFKEDIADRNLPYLVRLFLSKNKPNFRWTEDQEGQRLMWEKLTKSLASNKKMNDILPI